MTSEKRNAKPVAKSLHTVTVIVQVAQLHRYSSGKGMKPENAIADAMATLGLAGREDPHGLAAAALKQFSKGN